MKKRIFAMAMALIFALTLIPTMAVYADEISVTVNGEPVIIEGQQPVIVDGRTLVPVRAAFEAMGFDVDWNPEYRQAVLSRGQHLVVLTIDSATFFVGAQSRTLDVPAQIIGGSTMVPLRAVLESVGYDLDWDGATSTVIITSGAPVIATTLTIDPTDPLHRLRADDHHYWIADIISRWAAELDMTVDEIFDYVRAATTFEYAFDYGIEGGMDVSELAARVGETSVGFMGIIHMAYDSTRSVDVAHRWAAELNMTALELVDYVFGGNDSQHLADTLGLEWGEFQTVLAGVGNNLRNAID